MGLGKVDDIDRLESGSSGSSPSSSGSAYPKYRDKYPAIAICCDDGGNWSFSTYPETPRFEFEKKNKNSSWERVRTPSEVKKYWMDKTDFLRVEDNVERHFGVNIWKVLREDPEKGAELITRAANLTSGDPRPQQIRTCVICDKEHPAASGEYREVKGKAVCKRHNVEELNSEGLLE